ncbi:MFS transporter [Caloranaerobacter azorensis]|uniref:MFS transporter n=1 Tax=Caloranaerobacter azorensis TaxID=116090 RepID=A0A6P1YIF4_9FIRM|nr:MFS transporter [Caloranaerobacter azorensis]QIB28005.1 MFS transporter [Caloranaerobacter azorensis]
MNERVVKEKISYKVLFKETEYIKYIIGKLISRFGDSLDIVAYGWMVFKLTGSAAMLATLYAVNGIPSILFNIISGVVVSYLPKKRVVYLCDIGRGLTVFLTAFLFIKGFLQPWHLFVFTFINSTFEAFRAPSDTSLLTQIISKEKFEHAMSLDSSIITFVELIGYSIAGTLIMVIGIGGVIFIDAITFFICGFLIALIKVPKETLKEGKLTVNQYFRDLSEGTRYILKKKFILNVCIFAGMFNLFLVPFNSMMPAYVEIVLNRGPNAISVMATSFSIAMIIGSMLVPIIKNKLSGFQMFIISGIIFSLCYASLSQLYIFKGALLVYLPLIIICALMGLSVPMMNVPLKVALMSRVEQEYIPRTVSFVNALALSTTPIGGGIVGLLVGFISLQNVYLLFSIVLLLLFIAQIFNKSMRTL